MNAQEKALIPVAEFEFTCRWFWLKLSTPDFGIVTPHLRPRFLPRLTRTDLGSCSEFRWMVTLTWFFHLTVAYGRPLPPEPTPEPEDGDSAGVTYRVILVDGSTHDVPGDVWRDDGMSVGDTYTSANCSWWDDILDGLRDAVPGTAEFQSVEVLEKRDGE